MSIGAYIPVHNQLATLRPALESLRQQTLPLDEILVVDDGSTVPGVRRICEELGVTLLENGSRLGRGAARARAMETLNHEFVLCCDATNVMDRDFLEKALEWMTAPDVGAVYGRIRQRDCRTAADRWRAAHLFREGYQFEPARGAHLSTWGALVRRSAAMAAGNYDARLTHSEDRDLGRRLSEAGFATVADPRISVQALISNSAREVLERYWRWNAGADESISIWGYLRLIHYGVTVMAREDLKARDWARIWITLVCPHYQFWRSAFSPTRTAARRAPV